MATNFTYATLTTAIQNYTEVTDTDVFSATITDGFITDAETRILRDVNIDADRKSQTGSLVIGQEYINAPAGCLAVRSIQVTEDDTSPNTLKYLEKRDVTFLNEYNNYGTAGTTVATGRDIPKYYAMFGGATGDGSTNSGNIIMAPTPDANYLINIHGNVTPDTLETGNVTNYISVNYPQLLLYACLVEAYGFLKGPMDMLTLYENKYKQELTKFASVQIGRRRRDDYTDGTVRIPIESANQ